MLFYNLTAPRVDKIIRMKQQEIHSHIQPDGKKIKILIDNEGHLTGEILHKGKILPARIKGLPTTILLDHIDNVKKILQLDCRFNIMFDDIEVIPRLRGGLFDPVSWGIIVTAAPYVATAVSGIVAGSWLFSGGQQSSAPESKADSQATTTTTAPINNTNHNNNSSNHHTEIHNHYHFFPNFSLPNFPVIGGEKINTAIKSATLITVMYVSYYFVDSYLRNRREESGNSPLHTAASSGDSDEVRRLLNVNSSFAYFQPKANVNAKNNDGDTALHLAIRHKFPEIVEILVQNKANVRIANNAKEIPLDMVESCSESMKTAIMTLVANPTQIDQRFQR